MERGKNRKRGGMFLSKCGRRSIDRRRKRRDEKHDGKIGGYLDRKRLVLNVRKVKVMRFRRGGSRMKKGGVKIERRKERGGEGV